MKVLFITCHPSLKGGISSWVRLIQAYNQKNKLIDDLYMYPSYNGKIEFAQDRTLFQRVFGGAATIFKSIAQLKRIIHEQRDIDVIHLTTSAQLALFRDIALLKIAKRNKIPAILHLRFGRLKEIAEKNTVEFKLLRYAMSLASYTVTIDYSSFRAAKQKLPDVNIINIPNAVNISGMEEISQTEETNNITFLGWVVKTKGIEELICAWNEIYKEYPQWSLKIIGPYTEEYFKEINDKYDTQGIIFTGEMNHSDAMQEIKNSKIFVLPSYTEGFPNVVVEAMALGMPIAATSVGAVPEMLDNDCGVVIEPQNEKQIATALRELINNPEKCNVYAQNAKQKALQEYSVEKVYERYIKIWNEVKELQK